MKKYAYLILKLTGILFLVGCQTGVVYTTTPAPIPTLPADIQQDETVGGATGVAVTGIGSGGSGPDIQEDSTNPPPTLTLIPGPSPTAIPGGGTTSGIEGQALVGPMCPVMQPGQSCPDQPYPTTITILDEAGNVVITFDTDEFGRFKVNLLPGFYTLVPHDPEDSPLPHAEELSITVSDGQYTHIIIPYDSGIR